LPLNFIYLLYNSKKMNLLIQETVFSSLAVRLLFPALAKSETLTRALRH